MKKILMTLGFLLFCSGVSFAQDQVQNQAPDTSNTYETLVDETENPYPGWEPVFEYLMGFPKKDDVNGGSWLQMAGNFGVNYAFTKNFYIGMRIGYAESQYHYGKTSDHKEFNSYMVTMPIEAGARVLEETDKFGINVYGCFDLNYCVKSVMKDGIGKNQITEKTGYANKLGANLRLGLRTVLFRDWYLGVAYNIPINNNQKFYVGKDPYFGVTVGWVLFKCRN